MKSFTDKITDVAILDGKDAGSIAITLNGGVELRFGSPAMMRHFAKTISNEAGYIESRLREKRLENVAQIEAGKTKLIEILDVCGVPHGINLQHVSGVHPARPGKDNPLGALAYIGCGSTKIFVGRSVSEICRMLFPEKA
jgi:hypothetical protein